MALLQVDETSGSTRPLIVETDADWVNLERDLPRRLPDGGILWASEKDGGRALWRHKRDGTPADQLLAGDAGLLAVVHVAAAAPVTASGAGGGGAVVFVLTGDALVSRLERIDSPPLPPLPSARRRQHPHRDPGRALRSHRAGLAGRLGHPRDPHRCQLVARVPGAAARRARRRGARGGADAAFPGQPAAVHDRRPAGVSRRRHPPAPVRSRPPLPGGAARVRRAAQPDGAGRRTALPARPVDRRPGGDRRGHRQPRHARAGAAPGNGRSRAASAICRSTIRWRGCTRWGSVSRSWTWTASASSAGHSAVTWPPWPCCAGPTCSRSAVAGRAGGRLAATTTPTTPSATWICPNETPTPTDRQAC